MSFAVLFACVLCGSSFGRIAVQACDELGWDPGAVMSSVIQVDGNAHVEPELQVQMHGAPDESVLDLPPGISSQHESECGLTCPVGDRCNEGTLSTESAAASNRVSLTIREDGLALVALHDLSSSATSGGDCLGWDCVGTSTCSGEPLACAAGAYVGCEVTSRLTAPFRLARPTGLRLVTEGSQACDASSLIDVLVREPGGKPLARLTDYGEQAALLDAGHYVLEVTLTSISLVQSCYGEGQQAVCFDVLSMAMELEGFTALGPWTDLGGGVAGTSGRPCLSGFSDLQPGSAVDLVLSGASAASEAWLFIGFGLASVPFKGGTFVPDIAPPGFYLSLVTDAEGELVVSSSWPAGVPAGFVSYYQFWVLDAGAPFGVSGSNGVAATAP